jgi:hypothetical protein
MNTIHALHDPTKTLPSSAQRLLRTLRERTNVSDA